MKPTDIRQIILLITCAATLIQAQAGNSGSNGNNDDPISMGLMQPVIDSSESYLASAAASSMLNAKGVIQCEPIKLDFCSKLAYKSTRLPNYFGDKNQFEVIERSAPYRKLIESRCSSQLLTYICELLVPICMPNNVETMKRFDIYPCRTLCRRVKQDCESELLQLNTFLIGKGANQDLPGFDCDQLPYEANGGDGRSLYGPCHDLPHVSSNSSQFNHQSGNNKNPYQEFEPSFDANVPPFITDTSPLDLGAFKGPNRMVHSGSQKPTNGQQPKVIDNSNNNNNNNNNNNANNNGQKQTIQTPNAAGDFLHQLQISANNVIAMLMRHSNVLTVALFVCILLILNTRRLGHLSKCVCGTGSRSAGGVVVVGNANGGNNLHHHHHHHTHPTRHRNSPLGCWLWPIGRSSSSSSSASSQRKLTAAATPASTQIGSGIAGAVYPPIDSASAAMAALRRQQHGYSMSPSSSSRSLMMIASSLGKRGCMNGAATHQVVGKTDQLMSSSMEPSQKLLAEISAQSKHTLINVNGSSLERNMHLANHKLAYGNKRALFEPDGCSFQQHQQQNYLSTLGSHSSGHSNHYDYIQLAANSNNGAASDCDQLIGFGGASSSSASARNGSFDFAHYPQQQQNNRHNCFAHQFNWQHQTENRCQQMDQQRQQQQRKRVEQREHQLYSNILLSSPSHSVLLFNSNGNHYSQPQTSEEVSPAPPPVPSTQPPGPNISKKGSSLQQQQQQQQRSLRRPSQQRPANNCERGASGSNQSSPAASSHSSSSVGSVSSARAIPLSLPIIGQHCNAAKTLGANSRR